ncbi:MAG: methionine--tRNA ligase [Myxococcaceae bacterium]|nr:methionine--tRNA ligase [Myxococcaceae bacterium]
MATLVTCALPYANGSIHLGHMVEHVQTDIHVRFLRSTGEQVLFLCADDTHGTPIELAAMKQGVTPEAFIARFHEEHQKDFRDFDVVFDAYHSTNSPENKHYAELIYGRLKDQGFIERRDVEQAFDPKANRFLPDRFIRGTCPNCGATDQYGDGCEKCGATYSPKELKDPKSAISGEAPIWKSSPHLFFMLSKQREFLKALLERSDFVHPGLAAQLKNQFFEKGLSDWDISRDAPYFGFAIPGEKDKFFYVWLDAPIGYISTTEKWSGKKDGALEYWNPKSPHRIVHCIGKDIVYFHCLFWPAVLDVAGFKRPDRVHVHGHLTVDGEKMSKTRGTFINARTWLDHLDPSYLRFFYASMLGPGPEDVDLSLTEFRQRVNAELVNNLGNLANRSLSLLAHADHGKKLAAAAPGEGADLVKAALARVPEIRAAFAAFDSRTAMKAILEIGQSANQFLTKHEPWKRKKTDLEGARSVLSDAAEIVYLLTALLEPVVPKLAAKLREQLNAPPLTFKQLESAQYPLLDRARPTGDASPIINRLDEEQVAKIIVPQAPPAPAKTATAAPAAKPKADAGPPPEIEYPDFAKVELKVGKVLAAEKVQKADKLLKLTVDLGESAPRTIVSGIAEAYAPEALVGRNVVVVANLKPRALKGIESRGMILTAGPGGKELTLLDPGPRAPGSEVK